MVRHCRPSWETNSIWCTFNLSVPPFFQRCHQSWESCQWQREKFRLIVQLTTFGRSVHVPQWRQLWDVWETSDLRNIMAWARRSGILTPTRDHHRQTSHPRLLMQADVMVSFFAEIRLSECVWNSSLSFLFIQTSTFGHSRHEEMGAVEEGILSSDILIILCCSIWETGRWGERQEQIANSGWQRSLWESKEADDRCK